MTYSFVIQASNPRALVCFDADDASLSDAIQTVFPLEAEYALLTWNWIYVPLSYKYDLSLMVDDIIALVEAMTSEEGGHKSIRWPSNTFAATWNIDWKGGEATITATWECVIGSTEGLLNSRPIVVVGFRDFVREWRRPLEVVTSALESAGYTAQAL